VTSHLSDISSLLPTGWRRQQQNVNMTSCDSCRQIAITVTVNACLCLRFPRTHTHTQPTTTQQQPFYGPLSGTTRVNRYQKKHSPTHHPIFISFHLPRSIAFSLFKFRAWQSFCTTSVRVLFGLPLGLEPSTSYSIHFVTQSVSSYHNTCPYHRNLFCCSINIIIYWFTAK